MLNKLKLRNNDRYISNDTRLRRIDHNIIFNHRHHNNHKERIMEQLQLLEQELIMLQENISRVKVYQQLFESERYSPNNSNVVGELKHRMKALKQRLTLVGAITTADLFNK